MRISDWSSDVCSSDLDLRAQALDRDFDDVGIALEIDVPDLLGDHGLGDDLAMTARQRRQQREFLGGEIETLGVAPRATTEQIDLQIADRDLHRILAAASPRDCLQACQQLDRKST